jgi:hypothetical protein
MRARCAATCSALVADSTVSTIVRLMPFPNIDVSTWRSIPIMRRRSHLLDSSSNTSSKSDNKMRNGMSSFAARTLADNESCRNHDS